MSFTIFIDVAQNTSLYFKFNLNYGILNLFEIERRKNTSHEPMILKKSMIFLLFLYN